MLQFNPRKQSFIFSSEAIVSDDVMDPIESVCLIRFYNKERLFIWCMNISYCESKEIFRGFAFVKSSIDFIAC